MEDVVSQGDTLGADDVVGSQEVNGAEDLAGESDLATEEPKKESDGCSATGAPAAQLPLLLLLAGLILGLGVGRLRGIREAAGQ